MLLPLSACFLIKHLYTCRTLAASTDSRCGGRDDGGCCWRPQAEKGRLPGPGSEADADVLLEKAKQLNASAKSSADIDEEVLKLLAFGASGDLNPMAAMFGGIVGQEVVKAASGKFHPLYQWLYFDSVESLPAIEHLTSEECAPQVRIQCTSQKRHSILRNTRASPPRP